MKNLIHKIQDLSQKAAQMKQAIEAAPAQAAQLRDTVLMSAGQLQQIRGDVQTAMSGLRADSGDRLTQALRELNDHADTFLEAGYQLIGVEMEVSPVQRLIVRLARVESVAVAQIHALISANVARTTISALLTSLAKAEGLTAQMHLSNLSYRELLVHVGPSPSVRLCWHADEVIEAPAHPQPPPLARTAPAVPATATPSPTLQAFGSGSYFEQRTPVRPAEPAPVAPPAPAPHVETHAGPATAAQTAKPSASDWKQSALERFKKMPEGSKYRR
jgi:hypothetical protein